MKFDKVYDTMRNMGIDHLGSSNISNVVIEEVNAISSLLKISTDLVMIRIREVDLIVVKSNTANMVFDHEKGKDNRNWDEKETNAYSSVKVSVYNLKSSDGFTNKYTITFDFDRMFG